MSVCRKRDVGEVYAGKRWTYLLEGAVTVWALKLHIAFVNYSRTLCTSASARPVWKYLLLLTAWNVQA